MPLESLNQVFRWKFCGEWLGIAVGGAGGSETRPYWTGVGCFAESHAATVKQIVITIEKAMGKMKRYLQLTTVMAAKQSANAHRVPRMSARLAAGRPPSCHARIAANR